VKELENKNMLLKHEGKNLGILCVLFVEVGRESKCLEDNWERRKVNFENQGQCRKQGSRLVKFARKKPLLPGCASQDSSLFFDGKLLGAHL